MGKNKVGQKKSVIIKILIPVIILIVLGGLGFTLYETGVIDKIINPHRNEEELIQLEAPKNINFDEDTFILSFDAVENANKYYIYILVEDKTYSYETTDTEYQVSEQHSAADGEDIVFDIVAKGDGSKYKNSEATSYAYTYKSQNGIIYGEIYGDMRVVLSTATRAIIGPVWSPDKLHSMNLVGTELEMIITVKAGPEVTFVKYTVDCSNIENLPTSINSIVDYKKLVSGLVNYPTSNYTLDYMMIVDGNDYTDAVMDNCMALGDEVSDLLTAGYTKVTPVVQTATKISEVDGKKVFKVYGLYDLENTLGEVIRVEIANEISIDLDESYTTDEDYYTHFIEGKEVDFKEITPSKIMNAELQQQINNMNASKK